MSADDHRETGGLGLEIQLGKIVQHIDGNAAGFEYFSLRQPLGPCAFIDVAPDRRDRGDGAKLIQNLRCAHISRMNNVVRSAQSLDGFRTQQAVRVGDNANLDVRSPDQVLG